MDAEKHGAYVTMFSLDTSLLIGWPSKVQWYRIQMYREPVWWHDDDDDYYYYCYYYYYSSYSTQYYFLSTVSTITEFDFLMDKLSSGILP